MKSLLRAATLASLLLCGGAVIAQTGYSTEQSSIGQLLDNPATRAILMKYFPDVATDKRIDQAREMTLQQVKPFSQGAITDARLAAMDADLAKLSPSAAPVTAAAAPAATDEWLTWGYDPERTGWNRGETTLTPKNVGKLKRDVERRAGRAHRQIRAVHHDRAGGGGGRGHAHRPARHAVHPGRQRHAVRAGCRTAASMLWQKAFPNPRHAQEAQGMAVPRHPQRHAGDRQGARHGLLHHRRRQDARAVGWPTAPRSWRPIATVAPFARAWSLNLIDNVVYTTSGPRLRRGQRQELDLEYAAAISGLRRAGARPAAGCQRA